VIREVTRSSPWLLAHEEALVVAQEEANLEPAFQRHLGDGCEAVRDIRELQPLCWRQIARPSEVLGHDVANAGQHANATVLELHSAAAPEGIRVAVLGQAGWIPEANRCLHSHLALECASRHPHLRTSGTEQAVLSGHATDGQHRQAAIIELSIQ